jgi:hypothetical protein
MSACLPFQARLLLCKAPPPRRATLQQRVQHFLLPSSQLELELKDARKRPRGPRRRSPTG